MLKVEVLGPRGHQVTVDIPLGCRPVKSGQLTKAGDLFLQGGRHGLDGRPARWLNCIAGQRIEEAAIVVRAARSSD